MVLGDGLAVSVCMRAIFQNVSFRRVRGVKACEFSPSYDCIKPVAFVGSTVMPPMRMVSGLVCEARERSHPHC